MRESYVFTSESVSEGHPDKVCDQISDAILDYLCRRDPHARVAVETLATTNKVILAGEIRAQGLRLAADGDTLAQEEKHEIARLVRQTVRQIGYEQERFHWETVDTEIFIHGQSEDIAQGVDKAEGHEEGAGDQGIMFGYACQETQELMPAPILYAHRILRALADRRREDSSFRLLPDAKSQVTVRYEKGIPVRVEKVLVSHQHPDSLSADDVFDLLYPYVNDVLSPLGGVRKDQLLVNPTGRFVIGGPDGDAGLTGRKIIVDTYGGAAPHGGGAFSGKDCTKVDRSGAYMARYLAKNIVAAGLARRCTIQLAYAIGIAEPFSVYVNTHDTGVVAAERIEEAICKTISLTPRAIRKRLALNRPIYAPTAAYGHFGRAPEGEFFTWERTNLIRELQEAVG